METASRRIKLWDLPVRLVHWSFVVLIGLLWWTAENGKLDLHFTLGLIMLGLVVFRLIWGLIGSENARFAYFLKGPGTVIGYFKSLRGEHAPVAGHNPAGGWSAFVLLLLLAAQAGTGLFAQSEDSDTGPLNYLISYDRAESITGIHHLLFTLLQILIVLHIAAIVFYAVVKKDRLVPPMITGSRELPESVAAPKLAPLWRALVVAAFAAAFAWWIGKGAPTTLQQLTAPPQPAVEDYM